jgi:small Trp-rich protein
MYFVLLGLLLLGLKLAEIGPTAAWPWYGVLAPFAGAVIWWAWADATGYYKRREMRKLEEKKDLRRERSMDSLGTNPRNRRDR